MFFLLDQMSLDMACQTVIICCCLGNVILLRMVIVRRKESTKRLCFRIFLIFRELSKYLLAFMKCLILA